MFDPTVPQSSTLCQPVPIATFELIVVLPKSERICRLPFVPTALTLMTAPFAAVRIRNRSAAPDVRLTFALMQGVIVVVGRFRHAHADWAVTAARALGSAGEPIVESKVTRVAVQPVRLGKSSV